jgi:hypothetical protein
MVPPHLLSLGSGALAGRAAGRTRMRVLVACEFSGIVRVAFIAAGHDAVSCDLLPTERPGPHYQGNVLDIIEGFVWGPWDLMIAHPPCTYLANSGVRWLYGGKGTTVDHIRWNDMLEAALFFGALLNAPIPRIAVENPIMHRYGREIIGRGHDQIVQPWQFGHPETKATCLWLKGLPPLEPTNIVAGREPRVHHASPGPDRWKERSRTLPGIAAAMAAQWGEAVERAA